MRISLRHWPGKAGIVLLIALRCVERGYKWRGQYKWKWFWGRGANYQWNHCFYKQRKGSWFYGEGKKVKKTKFFSSSNLQLNRNLKIKKINFFWPHSSNEKSTKDTLYGDWMGCGDLDVSSSTDDSDQEKAQPAKKSK